jgi:hypothetical protein
VAVSNENVKRFILEVLADGAAHDWDDAMIAVAEGFDKVNMSLAGRQSELCLQELIDEGKVVEKWRGDWATLRRVNLVSVVSANQRELF